MRIAPILKSAIDALLWVQTYVDDPELGSTTLHEAGLSEHPDDYEINPAISLGLYEILHDFVEAALEINPDIFDGWTPEQIGLDFILTANGHGTGFWDRYLDGDAKEQSGLILTHLCESFGAISAYLDEETNIIEPLEGFERN